MEEKSKKVNLKIIIPVAVAIVIIAIIGIVLFTKDKGKGETTESELPDTIYKVGDTVKTDIAEFTLNECALTIALSNINDETYFTPREYDASRDARNPFVAKTGRTYTYVDFTISAIDRSSVKVNDTFQGNFVEIKYNNNSYKRNFIIGMEKTEKSAFANVNANNKWEKYTATNILISAGGKSQYKCYADIEEDIKNLNDKFYITFYLPNSKGTTPFTYVVNE